ncbi:hypothetical protein [Mangrovibacterium diazotrophicum]|uniref:Uncharacterized protein n=1 Tax=Mangrovibacterium diazotrophicum TaxID=1261403 RepID=A0A419W883_9BACT|nr:hypothetical protein [Mangrovibacterium diazotrophicum]RKD91655.1 hypothetical protein BC643_2017 [Mangrovibacterium diazotrophicum]
MNVQEETYRLLAEKLVTAIDSKRYVDWAVSLLVAGLESESLIILAGLDNYPTEEREKYFWQSVNELNLDFKKSDFELIEDYSIYTAQKVLSGELNELKALKILNEVWIASDYNPKYRQFGDLLEDVDYLEYEGTTIFNSGLNKNNIEKFVKTEFELFLKAEELKLDNEIREKSICDKCDLIVKPKLKTKHKFISSKSYQIWVCGNCGSEKIEHFSSQNGKRRIIERKLWFKKLTRR